MPLLPIYEGPDVEARVSRYALFCSGRLGEVSKRLAAYAGLRAERIETREQGVGDQQDSVAASVVTPMFHLKYKLDEKGEHLFRSSPTSTFKAPEPMQPLARPQVSPLTPIRPGPTTRCPPTASATRAQARAGDRV